MSKAVSYIQESYDEFVNKASWPTFTELQKSTVLVVVSSIIFALVIFAMDKAITAVLEVIYEILK
ncbi:MAG: preprotein translocase subunit SecE [Bacteroidota bacterium]|nr:preprotein translocase subunit SecE [Bacteroidota bacterium]MDX5427708.1 preprotein translocase subunit SecE [Bacteroidota bacterium]MDX5446834.1 preprotein translocase subunit SecE [Bacteroidota bacterium]MDX5505603.1 preprotein translocase subunit SecE [Bacteroidota bacterium]